MNAITTRRIFPAVLILGLAWPSLLLADTPGTEDSHDSDRSEEPTVLVVGDDGETTTFTLRDGQLTIVSDGDGHSSTRIIDMEAMGLLAADAVDDALVGLEDVLGDMGRMQFQYRAGQDNRLNFSFDDTEFELDIDAVMEQVASAVQLGLAEINTAEWTNERGRWDAVSDDELRDELENLKDEMKELRRELRRLQQDTDAR